MSVAENDPDFDWANAVDYAARYNHEPLRTQYELPGLTEELHPVACSAGGDHEGVRVAVVPLWHAMVTARLNIPTGDADALRDAQRRLEAALAEIERTYPLSPAGLLPQVAWGLPYFARYVPPSLVNEYLPKSIRQASEGDPVLIEAIRFPRDPDDLNLERNEVCFHFKSDFRDHINESIAALFSPGETVLNGIATEHVFIGDLVTLTSIRRGFAGRGMPHRVGVTLGIPGAEAIPRGSMLFMGFTSSHVHGLAAGNLASYETVPGWTDCAPGDYMAGGANMHVSHISIKLEQWYALGHSERLQRMFDPRRTDPDEVLSPDQCPASSTFRAERDADIEQYGLVGHNEQMQFLSRVEQDTTTAYGQVIPRGTTFFLRQDFDTVENPFEFWTDGPVSALPRAGVHFIGMGPSAQHFHLMRQEMDSPDLTGAHQLPDENVGFTDFLINTHRQNYCLPPRAHRSFPMVELL